MEIRTTANCASAMQHAAAASSDSARHAEATADCAWTTTPVAAGAVLFFNADRPSDERDGARNKGKKGDEVALAHHPDRRARRGGRPPRAQVVSTLRSRRRNPRPGATSRRDHRRGRRSRIHLRLAGFSDNPSLHDMLVASVPQSKRAAGPTSLRSPQPLSRRGLLAPARRSKNKPPTPPSLLRPHHPPKSRPLPKRRRLPKRVRREYVEERCSRTSTSARRSRRMPRSRSTASYRKRACCVERNARAPSHRSEDSGSAGSSGAFHGSALRGTSLSSFNRGAYRAPTRSASSRSPRSSCFAHLWLEVRNIRTAAPNRTWPLARPLFSLRQSLP
jgi:hypothetical protein